MKPLPGLIIQLLFLLCACYQSHAKIIYVPTQYPTIQLALNASSSGDTVIVTPGTYKEHISFPVTGIRLGSMFMITGDTSYISQTILKPKNSGQIVSFRFNLGPSTLISGFTITNAMSQGGIYCYNASPTISDCRLIANTSQQGGGIYCEGGAPVLRNLLIKNNYAHLEGGGVFLVNSDAVMIDVLIADNTAPKGGGLCSYNSDFSATGLKIQGNTVTGNGGGVCLENSDPSLTGCSITGNHAEQGGGLFINKSDPVLSSNVISNNYGRIGGGVVTCSDCQVLFRGNSITGNTAKDFGGGLYFYNAGGQFSSGQLNSIFGNRALVGGDLFRFEPTGMLAIPLDTFSVRYPSDHYAEPVLSCSITMQHQITEQVDADLYVSPSGNDTNTGLNGLWPLRTLTKAFSILHLDSTRRYTVYLQSGNYTPANGETFPINIPNYIQLTGLSKQITFFTPETYDHVLWLYGNNDNVLSNFIIRGGGIYCYNSEAVLKDITMTDTLSDAGEDVDGGGLDCWNSAIKVHNLDISGFRTTRFGGGIYLWNSSLSGDNLRITNCHGTWGGAICIAKGNVVVRNMEITGNSSVSTGGAMDIWNGTLDLAGATFAGNISGLGTASFRMGNTSMKLTNSIFRDDSIPGFQFEQGSSSCNLTVQYCDIRGGQSSIVTNGSDTVNWLDGNIDLDPGFSGSGTPVPYSLRTDSPCRDAGTPDTTGLFIPWYDLVQNLRIWNNRVDMGAYEFNSDAVNDKPGNLFGMEIFPNPSDRLFTLRYRLRNPETVAISILNGQGKPVRELYTGLKTAGRHEITMNGSTLSAGIYFLHIKTAGAETSKKFIVSH